LFTASLQLLADT